MTTPLDNPWHLGVPGYRLHMAGETHGGVPRTQWLTHGERTLYASDWLRLALVDVTAPDGRRFEHHVVRMQRVAVAAVLDDAAERLLMIRRHRFIDESWGWEVPVGIVERDEEPLGAAMREVAEETGWRPRSLSLAMTFQPAIGIADSPHDVFIGRGAELLGKPSDVTEAEAIAWIPLEDLYSMTRSGEIRDGASVAAVFEVLCSGRGS